MFRLATSLILLCSIFAGDAFSQSTQRFRRKDNSFRGVVKEAIRQADNITGVQKLRLRVGMALKPEMREAIEDHLLEHVNTVEGVSVLSVDAKIDPDKLERILQILIQYLPQLIEIISDLFGHISVQDAVFMYAYNDPLSAQQIVCEPVEYQLAA